MSDDKIAIIDGRVVLTDAEKTYLQQFIDAHDRPGFYMAYYSMMGGAIDQGGAWSEMALQAQISSFSGAVGGVAYYANFLEKELLPDRYAPDVFE